MKEIAGKKQEENSSDSDMQKSQGNAYLEKTKPQHDETQKAVSWKKEIETTQEFQGSVLEQNVVVNLEVPDEEYVKKENDTETSVEGEKLGNNSLCFLYICNQGLICINDLKVFVVNRGILPDVCLFKEHI